MKNKTALITIFVLFLVLRWLPAQEASSFIKEGSNTRHTLDSMDFVPDEILIKFKDGVEVTAEKLLNFSLSSKGVNSLLAENKIEIAEKLFPGEKMKKSARVVKTPQGNDMVIPNLHNIYKIVLAGKKSTGFNPYELKELIYKLKALPEVEYAEPNYYYSIGDFKPTSPEMTVFEAMRMNDGNSKGGSGLVPNDPLYSQQWGIPATNVDDVWLTHTGDTTSVIAIIDSGVDWLHPDLAENIWTNRNEIPENGKDDDDNGFIDDVRGWDFINNDNDPKDDNSHGTHCAGIAAAVGNNSLGIAGVNWKGRIMPVKVFQSSGWATASTVSIGINYASSNGANVLSMSFGGYGLSMTMEQSLANAYATAVLVAAAGNDGLCIGPGKCKDLRIGMPLYPGGFSFVLGVESTNEYPDAHDSYASSFTNFDQDGPVFSAYPDLYNYELKAPGSGILSCVPGGNYRSYSGTSMSAPLVAGIASIYRELKPTDSQEMMWGNMIYTIGNHINAETSLTVVGEPKLAFVNYTMADTLDGDREGDVDAGETIELVFKIQNSWTTVNDAYIKLDFAEFEDQSVADIINDSAFVGSVSNYATRKNPVPLKVKIKASTANNRDIRFTASLGYGTMGIVATKNVTLSVTNGTELRGIMDTTLVLTPDRLWINNGSFKVGRNGTLVLSPGTHLILKSSLIAEGNIIANGLKSDNVIIEGPMGIVAGNVAGVLTANYCKFINMRSIVLTYFTGVFSNCIFESFDGYVPFYHSNAELVNCLIINMNAGRFTDDGGYNILNAVNCNFSRIKSNEYAFGGFNTFRYSNFSNINFVSSSNLLSARSIFSNNNVLTNNKGSAVFCSSGADSAYYYDNTKYNYWGTTDKNKISKKIFDFWDNPNQPIIVFEPFLTRPSSLAHGCVWKILVNGIDTQDQTLDPVGVGTHKFEIYFNKPMDVTHKPQLSMGVRYPYTQTAISKNGNWSADSIIWTCYYDLGLTPMDGINRLRVVAARDTAGWEIPEENERFEILINAAGSASLGFEATPGFGKIGLEWDAPDKDLLEDLFGYNMYRFERVNDSTYSDTILINRSLITDTLYTDYNVLPGRQYFYGYKNVRTDLSESDMSKVVSAIPLTSQKGDANGDLSLNVSDIISTVSYILMKNPQPFIFAAADYNTDGIVNVLDITLIVNKILNPGKSSQVSKNSESATLFRRGDTLFVDSPVALGGIQFTVRNTRTTDYKVLAALESFERVTITASDSLFFLAYSMSGKTFGPGIVPLLKFNNGFLDINNIVLSTPSGNSLNVTYKEGNTVTVVKEIHEVLTKSLKATPNPFSNETIISFRLPVKAEMVTFLVFNSSGIKVDEIITNDLFIGDNHFVYNPNMGRGLYIMRMIPVINGKRGIESSLKLIIN